MQDAGAAGTLPPPPDNPGLDPGVMHHQDEAPANHSLRIPLLGRLHLTGTGSPESSLLGSRVDFGKEGQEQS